MTTRRDFLSRSCAAFSGAALASALTDFGVVDALAHEIGAAGDYRALVCVFLNGGNDAWNTIVPLDEYSAYASARSAVALPSSSLLPIVPPSDGRRYGLHPALSSLHGLWQRGRVAIVANVGPLRVPLTRTLYLNRPDLRPESLFSHSDQIHQWQAAVSGAAVHTGWGGRTSDHTRTMNGAATFPTVVSLAGANVFGTGAVVRPFQMHASGPVQLAGTSGSTDNAIRYAAFRRILGMQRDIEMVRAAGQTLEQAIEANDTVTAALDAAPPLATAFPASTLGQQLQMVARLISARGQLGMRRQIFFCSLIGFDTHGGQLNVQSALLQQVSDAMTAFHAATEELGVAPNVTAFTHSDFGRALRSNGSGTDHGWGSCQLVVGGSVRGGDFYGRWPTLVVGGPDDASSQGRFIPTTAVEEYCATLAGWYGLPAGDIPVVFPHIGRFQTTNMGFMA